MKKLLLIVFVVFCFIIVPSGVNAKNDVTIYLFRGNTCPHCEEALEYMNNHKDEIPEGVQVETYEVWNNKNNSKLQEAVAKKLGVDTDSDNYGVPFIVIGEEYITGYNGVVTFNKIVSLSENYLEDEEYKDIVQEEVKELNINVKSLTLDKLFSEPSKLVTIIVYSIFGVVVLGFLAMILFSRK